MDAEYIFFNHFVGRVDEQKHQRICDHLLAVQNEEGAWPYSTRDLVIREYIEAYFALKLTGYPATHPALLKARAFILAQGGLARRRYLLVFSCLFGQFPWRGVSAVPVELMLLPNWFPINIYEMSSWARGTVVPLSVILAQRPYIPIPKNAASPNYGKTHLNIRT